MLGDLHLVAFLSHSVERLIVQLARGAVKVLLFLYDNVIPWSDSCWFCSGGVRLGSQDQPCGLKCALPAG